MAKDQVTVSTGARLHLGFLNLGKGPARRFGGLGLALDAPATRITVTTVSGETVVEGPSRTRARWHLEALRPHLMLDHHHHHLRIESVVPGQAGLGSGTGIALCVGTALRALNGLAPDPADDAAYLGRAKRSGLGPALFQQGGLVVDAGVGPSERPAPPVARLAVPAAWRVVLMVDPAESGPECKGEAFDMAPGAHDTACRLVLTEALPAVAEGDLAAFGRAAEALQALQAKATGGFASKRVVRAAAIAKAGGACGVGQSFRGPTGFAFLPGEAEAKALVARLKASPDAEGLEFHLASPRNEGVTATSLAAAA